jgi:lysyl-tRNA synthetase class 2
MSQSDEAAARLHDRRHQRAWVPSIAALLTLLIGASDIYSVLNPHWPHKLHGIKMFVPGTVDNATHSAEVIIGLLLLLLAHGLRRRKRRAWQAVTGLLAFDIAPGRGFRAYTR